MILLIVVTFPFASAAAAVRDFRRHWRAGGAVATLLLFGELHLMTLVMSMSIIGISADYTLYYLTERMGPRA